ncbi:hypothetical protein IOD13_16910 [Brevibacterium casei]|nr:hypothetical protein [Brevibacterium casei]
MSENTEPREQVRTRYAQAATAVTTGTRNADLLVEETPASSCCALPAAEDTGSDSDSSRRDRAELRRGPLRRGHRRRAPA